ncbi:MAG: protein kinase [Deltaproteobacteria bacterium]|nr:protein kinase [Deltaproteobacteria bacterium]
MSDASCIDDVLAARLVAGKLTPAQESAARGHARSCTACAKKLTAALRDRFDSRAPTIVAAADDGASPPSSAAKLTPILLPPPPGTGVRIGRYLTLAPIGEGGMGQVFSAFDLQLERKVAIKLLRPDVAEGESSASAQARLLREAQAMAQLSHPNVVDLHDFGTYEGGVFLAMGLVEGGDVLHWLRREARSPKEILAVFLAAGRGLAAAHAKGIVHRDFKPPNVLVGSDGVARITDFGIARADPETGAPSPSASLSSPLTLAGAVVGTPGYMSPEQLAGEPATPLSDQFSFAVSLWQALYGKRPFGGINATEQLEAICKGEVEPEPAGSRVPQRLRRILLRALAEQPEKRFPSMEALLDELAADPWARRRRWLTAGAIVLAAFVVGAGLLQSRLERRRLCHDARSQLGGIWDGSRRATARKAILESGHLRAASTWAALEPLLDRYADQWAAMSEQACVAALVEGTESAHLFGLRSECLQRRHAELGSLVGLMERANPAFVERASQVASALSPLSACANAAALRANALPADAATREEIERVEEGLAQVRLHRTAAQYAEADALLARLREAAVRLEHRPLQAKVELQAGLLHEETDELKQAERALLRAIARAEAGGDRATLAAAASRLMYVVGLSSERAEEGLAWGELASGALEALGTADPALEADVYSDRCAVYLSIARYPLALAEGRRALELRRLAFGEEHYLVARSLNNLAMSLEHLGQLAEGLEQIRQAVRIADKVLGPDHPQTLLFTNNLSVLLRDLGRLDEAESVALNGFVRSQNSLGEGHRVTSYAAFSLARVHHLTGDYSSGLQEARLALRTIEKASPKSVNAGAAWCLLGDLQLAAGEAAAGLRSFETGFAILLAEPSFVEADALEEFAGYGDALLSQGRFTEAIAIYERGRRAATDEDHKRPFVARLRFGLARALWEVSGDRDRSRQLAREAVELYSQVGFLPRQLAAAKEWLATHPASAHKR